MPQKMGEGDWNNFWHFFLYSVFLPWLNLVSEQATGDSEDDCMEIDAVAGRKRFWRMRMGASCKYNYLHPSVFEALGFGLIHIATCKADLLATDGIR